MLAVATNKLVMATNWANVCLASIAYILAATYNVSNDC